MDGFCFSSGQVAGKNLFYILLQKRNNSQEDLIQGPLFPAIVRLAIPLLLANLMQTAYNIIDTYWVGRLGEEAIAAISLAFPIIFLIISFGAGLTIAGTVLIAQYTGRQDQENVDLTAGQTIILLVNVSVVISLVGFFASHPILQLMGAEPGVLGKATVYLKILFGGAVFMFMFFVFQSILRGWGDTRTPMWVMFWSVLANTLLDPLLILGIGPFPKMGIAGAAWATIISRGAAAVVGLWILFSGRKLLHIRFRHLWPDWQMQWRLIKLGIPASVEQSITALGITAMIFIVADFGTTVVAAYGIGARVLSFVIVPAFAISMATSTTLGQNFGAGQLERAEKAGWIGAGTGFGALTLFGVLLFLFAEPVTAAFIKDNAEVVRLGSEFLRIMALTFGFFSLQLVFNGAFRGAGKTTTAMMMAFIAFWVTRIPVAYLLANTLEMGPQGIWWAFPISIVFMGLLTTFWFWLGRWKRAEPDRETRMKARIIGETELDEGVND